MSAHSLPSSRARAARLSCLTLAAALVAAGCSLDRAPVGSDSRDASTPDASGRDAGEIDASPAPVDAGPDAPRAPLGASCASDLDCASSACVDGVCCDGGCEGSCTACVQSATGQPDGTCAPVLAGVDPRDDCDAQEPSTCGRTGECDGAGACALYDAETLCAAATCTDGIETRERTCDGAGACPAGAIVACAPFVCGASGVCAVACTGASDCESGRRCDEGSGTCVPLLGDGAMCSAALECASGACVDGVCCESACTEACSACRGALTGAFDGQCRPISAGTDPDGECDDEGSASCGRDGACDGARACRLYAAGVTCAAASCAAGVASSEDQCDGAGACVDGGSVSCAPYTCGASACRSSCAADAECATGHFCEGGACVSQRAQGASCARGAECASGFCTDGVCCDTACTSTCAACVAARTGGADGVCAPIAAGTDPDAECAASSTSTCGTDGSCDGAGACRLHAAGTSCGASCTGASAVQSLCDGAGSCVAGTPQSCAPYVCGATACSTTCASDAGCQSGHYCSGGSCVPVLATGSACAAANQCGSGFCVDGVCCQSACTDTCSACSASRTGGTDGTCAAIVAGTDPDNECPSSSPSTCSTSGSCNGAGACALWPVGTICGAASCSADTAQLADTCDGAGTCDVGGAVSCAPYACGATECRSSCTGDADCAPGNTCIDGACNPAHALQIPNASARVLVSDTAGLFTDELTWELWVVFATNTFSDPPQSLMQVVDLDPANPYALVYLRALYDRFDCVIGTGSGQTVVSVPFASIATGVPHHVACTRTATEQVLWIDGARVASAAAGPFPHPADGTPLALGGDFRTPPEMYTFRGIIDEVRISSVARYAGAGPFTPARRFASDASTLGLWHFDEGSGTVTDNAAGPGRDGVVDGAVWVSAP